MNWIKILNLIIPKIKITAILFLLHCFFPLGKSARILFFLGAITSYSHRNSIQPLANSLAEKGHEVTFLSPSSLIPQNGQHDSIVNLCPPKLEQYYQQIVEEYGRRGFHDRVGGIFKTNEPIHRLLTKLFDTSRLTCQGTIDSPTFEKWVQGSPRFDLVIIDSAMNECAFGLAYFWKARTIIYGSIGTVTYWDLQTFGLTPELSWVPGLSKSTASTVTPTFLERLTNALATFSLSWTYQNYHLPKVETMLRNSTSLGHRLTHMPRLIEVIQNCDLILINQHHSDQFPRSYPPFVVPVGGMHLYECNGSLPVDLEKFIGDFDFFYVSFGSLLKFSTMPKHLLEIFFSVMNSFKNLRFLVKWDGPMKDESRSRGNILFHSWFPQEQVLAHSKIKGFITQGGQVSVQQAIFNQVPMIMIPIHGDQDYNARRMRGIGHGILLELAELTEQKLNHAIQSLLKDPSYKAKAKQLAQASRDRPISALKMAVWWVEYILRKEDLNLLKPLSMGQSLWIQLSLDIWTFISCLLITIFCGIIIAIKLIVRKCNSKQVPDESKIKRKLKRRSHGRTKSSKRSVRSISD